MLECVLDYGYYYSEVLLLSLSLSLVLECLFPHLKKKPTLKFNCCACRPL